MAPWMDTPSLLEQIRPRAHGRYEALPLFGSVIADYSVWLRQRGYTRKTNQHCLKAIRVVDDWLRMRGRRRLSDITAADLRAAHDRFRAESNTGGAARSLGAFLLERRLVSATPPVTPSFAQSESEGFGRYLRTARGFAESSILRHQRQLGLFLRFLGADQRRSRLAELTARKIDDYLRFAAKTNNRFSLQQVIANLRAYLRWRHSQGHLKQALHEGIDSPRCYRLERLPRALPWQQIVALLRSIDQSTQMGRRDFTLLYLAAHYGLRSAELVSLKLEDFDWRMGTVCLHQSKTKQAVLLPLTDEAGAVVSRYLRDARPTTTRRELFLRARAPMGPLLPTGVHDILDARIRRSGLPIKMAGTHMIRHSFALHLLREGASTKQIGDTLGHRDVESTCVYLRLDVSDFRDVGLPVPKPSPASPLVPFNWSDRLPKLYDGKLPAIRRRDFRGPFAPALRRYVAVRHALGRAFDGDERTLRQWDDFLVREHLRGQQFDRGLFERWNDELGRLSPTTRRNRLRVVRNFLLFHRRDHPRTWVPDQSLFPKRRPYRPAHVMRSSEIARLVATAERLPVLNCNPLRPQVIKVGILLLYCCGLRLGELLRLRLHDYDQKERVLRINETKFHKSRLVPLHASVARELQRFLAQWPTCQRPLEPDQPLVWSGRASRTGNGMTTTGFRNCWVRLCGSVGIRDHRGRPPHVHDLRHSMAVGALHRCYQQGGNPHALPPKLATYLGHVTPTFTHHYLQLTPELRQEANRRFRASCGQLFQNGGDT